METTINTATQEVAQPQSLAIDRQTIGDLAAFWARKLDEHNRSALSHERRLSCEIDKLMYYFQAAEQLPSVELEYLNRAVSFYLIHSPNAAHIKENVINSMSNAIRIAIFFEKYATNVSLWSSMFEALANVLDPSEPEYQTEQIEEELNPSVKEVLENGIESNKLSTSNVHQAEEITKQIKELTERLQDQENTAIDGK